MIRSPHQFNENSWYNLLFLQENIRRANESIYPVTETKRNTTEREFLLIQLNRYLHFSAANMLRSNLMCSQCAHSVLLLLTVNSAFGHCPWAKFSYNFFFLFCSFVSIMQRMIWVISLGYLSGQMQQYLRLKHFRAHGMKWTETKKIHTISRSNKHLVGLVLFEHVHFVYFVPHFLCILFSSFQWWTPMKTEKKTTNSPCT